MSQEALRILMQVESWFKANKRTKFQSRMRRFAELKTQFKGTPEVKTLDPAPRKGKLIVVRRRK